MEDGVFKKEPRIQLGEHQAVIDGFFRVRYERLVAKFLEAAAAAEGAVKTPTGLIYIETVGRAPAKTPRPPTPSSCTTTARFPTAASSTAPSSVGSRPASRSTRSSRASARGCKG